MKRWGLGFLIVGFFAAAVIAESSLAEFRLGNPGLRIPARTHTDGIMVNADGTEVIAFSMGMAVSNGVIRMTLSSPKSRSELVTNLQFQLLESDFISVDNSLTAILGYDRRAASMGADRVATFNFYLGAEIKKSRRIKYDDNTFDTFTVLPLLRHMLSHGIHEFTGHFVVQGIPLKSQVWVRYYELADVSKVASQYSFPGQASILKALPESAAVFEIGVAGFGSFFYPHKSYYVYETRPPYRFVATFGGPPKQAVYTLFSNVL